jgi:hypothetical protein
MNELCLSLTTKKLLAAAKADGPSATARAEMWNGVSSAVGAAGSGATTSTVVNGGTSATKLLAMGGLFGGTLVVGLAAVLLKIGAAPTPIRHSASPPMVQAALANAASPPSKGSLSTSTGHQLAYPPANRSAPLEPGRARVASRPATPAAHEDSLAREASLVAEARGALGRGDSAAALRAIHAARALPSRQLMPEELAVEEQALRAIGQSDQANGIDVQIRLQYPESALAR